MSWLFSQALVEAYSEGISLDGEQSAPLSGNPTPQAYLCSDKMMGFSRLSRFGMTFRLLTESRGEALLMSYLEGFPVKTSPPQEKAQELTESDQVCGEKWQGSLPKWSQLSLLSKTPQCSEQEVLVLYSMTLPRWGSMQDGVVFPLQPLVQTTKGTECGLWASPNARDWKDSGASQGKRKSPNLGTQVHWPTPRTKGMCGGSGAWDLLNKNTTVEEARKMGAGNGGKLNPTWVEWLMGWPLEWTDLKPLEMDKFQQWQQQHGSY